MTAPGFRAGLARADVVVAAAVAGLFALAAVVGALLGLRGHPVHAGAAPIFAFWLPHLGPGTPAAVAIAVLTVWYGPRLAGRLPWRRLLAYGYGIAVAWTLALAMIDGWQRGLAGRLTTSHEYLSEVGGVTDVRAMLRGFAGRILDFQPDSWTTHVSGHPPGAFLVFVWLDHLGLSGGGWAALTCVLAGSLIAVAVPATLRLLGDEPAARASVPFLALFPGAVWIGASADGLFAGVTATGLAVLAWGLTRRNPLGALGGGVILGYGAFLSYGLVLLAPVVLAVILLAWPSLAGSSAAGGSLARSSLARSSLARSSLARMVGARMVGAWPLLAWALLGAGAVVVAFAAAGFWWLDGYHLVVVRYHQGIADHRAYAYWSWANLAALAASAGPAAGVILRRALVATPGTDAALRSGAGLRSGAAWPARARAGADAGAALPASPPSPSGSAPPPGGWSVVASLLAGVVGLVGGRWRAAVLLPLAAFSAILVADVSGLSKAEVERIWLPFGVWLMAGAALLPPPSRRWWLAVQAVVALLINHLLLTNW
jgi:methylthioxylose transferase